jgi:hypothetical protein
MVVLYILLLVGAAVCFVLAAFGFRAGNARRTVDLIALGLFLWVLVGLIQMIQRV